MWILSKTRFSKCEFYLKLIFKNVNFAKKWILKMGILWKMGIQSVNFCPSKKKSQLTSMTIVIQLIFPIIIGIKARLSPTRSGITRLGLLLVLKTCDIIQNKKCIILQKKCMRKQSQSYTLGQNPTFYLKIPWNLMLEKMWIFWKIRFWQCEFC